jgi:asparagine synthase (glutamine-hydrolysing)
MTDFILCRGHNAVDISRKLRGRIDPLGLTFAPLIDKAEFMLLGRVGERPGSTGFWRAPDGGWILCTGLFSFRSKSGATALQHYYRDFDPSSPDLGQTRGQFTLVIGKAETTHLLSDTLGTNKIFHDTDLTLFSNLFIAVAEGLEAPNLDVQGCYEYVWNGVPFGERSFFRELRSLAAGHMMVIPPGGAPALRALPAPQLVEKVATSGGTRASAVSRQIDRLTTLMAETRDAFGDQINLLFSGGYDSRLLLALLLDAGMRPRLTVYGRPGDLDREIAQQVAEGENLEFNPVDKSAFETPPPEAYRDTLLANYVAFDGWKVTGLFDSGIDRLDRQNQSADGGAKMNGSLGEIHRNFFYLPDRPFKAREIVWCFHARYDPRAMTDKFESAAHEETIAAAMIEAVGTDSPHFTRKQVELVYPLFRGRYWTARDVPLNQGFGAYLTPFMEPSVIQGTPDWPISWKSHGIIEAEIIAGLSPRLASYPSVYGRPFTEPPSWRTRLRALTTYHRPLILRRLSYRLQQRGPGSLPRHLSASHLASVMDSGFPYMSALFKPENVHDEDAFNRIATLEFLCQRYQAKIAN